MEVVHEGLLERCIHVTDTKKEWKKGYFVFKKHTNTGSKTLEFYKDSNWRKQEAKGVINLYLGYNVNISNNVKKKYMFELTTADKTYELYTSSDAGRQKWIDVLNDNLIIKSFNAILIGSPASAHQYVKEVRGKCQLQITQSAVLLRNFMACVITWKFSIIRRYKSHNGAFVIEVGRKAMTGEGEFRFDTDNPVELFDVLDKAVKDRTKARAIEDKSQTKSIPVSNFDVSFRKPVSPPNTSPKPRAAIDHVTPVVVPLPVETQSEYSHIHSLAGQHASVKQESDYDQLFSKSRMVTKRRSEPVVPPLHLPLFDNIKKITANTKISPLLENNQVYVDMAGETTINVHEPKRPHPPPRTKAATPTGGGSPLKEPLKKANSSPIDENTYDAPTLSPATRAFSEKHSIDDYDKLFRHTNNNVIDASNYSRLNHDQINESVGLQNDSLYNKLSSQRETQPSSPARKIPLKPSRPAPVVPLVSPGSRENRKLMTSTGGGNVILKLRRNTSIQENDDAIEQPVYDKPSSQPIGYHSVGDIIPGEYHRAGEDTDGYMKVPHESNDEGIYQVPRGDQAI